MRYLNQFILFISISFILPASVYAEGMAVQPSGVFKFQQRLATNGNARAQYKLGTMYECGTGIEQDLEKAKHWYGLASVAEVKAASDRMTYLTIKEQGYDKEKNTEWLKVIKQEASSRKGDSMFLLAQLYREGLGVKKDLYKAMDILDQVSLLGAADVDNEFALIQTELDKDKKAKALAAKQREQESARIAEQEKAKQANNKPLKVQQAKVEKANKLEPEKVSKAEKVQAEKIRRYEKAMMQLQMEQRQIDKQQAWAAGGIASTEEDEF